jgi:hypothetical protein
MLTGIHFILTYSCNFECDHCFVYCSPRAQGTFTISQVARALNEARKIDTVEWIFFEGGEPLLYFPLLKESIRRASELGFKVGIVTNAYAASSQEDAELWLKPLADSGLSFLNISNDAFHYGGEAENPATVVQASPDAAGKGLPVVGGGAMFRGRAADTLTGDLPRRPWDGLCECPYEDLESPSRVHVDSYGNVQICQGISIGNMWQTPLSEIILNYRPDSHPICGPLLRGGPTELARELGIAPEPGYVDECHLCYSARKAVIDEFPDQLGPRQVYGLN